ncbi:MAG: shikimate kinase [Bacteroidia bacterium]
MPGVGKTTIGKKIAKLLNYRFFDLDMEIEKIEQKTVKEIFESKGENYFREKESEVLKKDTGEKVVVATGGGTPCYFNNMEFIKKKGLSIYLKASGKFIFNRILQSPANRPLFKNIESGEKLSVIKKMLAEREPWYLQADMVFEMPGVSAETIIESMVSV